MLRRLGVEPRKALGQHFLVDEFALAAIADACRLDGAAKVLEIGAGPGGLTEELLVRAGHVVAVELDEELAALTRQRLAGRGTLEVVAADVLELTPEELLEEGGASPPYIACGNLPYYITQPVVRWLIEAETPPERIVVMVQREVAERMVGGEGQESVLSLAIRTYGEAELLFEVPPESFFPPPKVHSAVVRLERSREPVLGLNPEAQVRFFHLVRAGFAEPRKQLRNTLRRSLVIPDDEVAALLEEAAIDETKRPQHIGLDDWRRLFLLVDERYPEALDVA